MLLLYVNDLLLLGSSLARIAKIKIQFHHRYKMKISLEFFFVDLYRTIEDSLFLYQQQYIAKILE